MLGLAAAEFRRLFRRYPDGLQYGIGGRGLCLGADRGQAFATGFCPLLENFRPYRGDYFVPLPSFFENFSDFFKFPLGKHEENG